MKFLEIVIASNGENLSWANGMQDIVIEYSTAEQQKFNKQKHVDAQYVETFSYRGGSFLNHPMSFASFLLNLKKDIKTAKKFYKEMDRILSLDTENLELELDILTGHKVVRIKNNENMCEANQYLTHIIQNYYSLSEYTVFTQGHPNDHVKDIKLEIIKNIGSDFSTLPPSKIRSLGEKDHELLARQFGEMVTGKKINKSIWSAGACFMASKNAILKNDISWYKNILNKGDSFKDSKFAIERLWSVLLSPNEDWS
jgi:hypothetical protein